MQCNNSLGPSEQIAALVANSGRNLGHEETDPYALSLIPEVARANPEVLTEMISGRQKLMRRRELCEKLGFKVGAYNIGPETNRHIQAVGAKLTCAIHYWETGNILPKEGGVFVRWWANANRLDGPILADNVWKCFGEPVSLTQGQKTSLGQFEYTSAIADTRKAGMYFSAFGAAFAILGVAGHNPELFARIVADGAYIHRPGDFLSYKENTLPGALEFSYSRPLTSNSEFPIQMTTGCRVTGT